MGIPTAVDVSNLFLSWANRDGDVITNLKMQKLLYYAQAWHLVILNKPLFGDMIEAWEFGPVIPTAYRFFKKSGARPISYKSTGSESSVFTSAQMEFLKEFYGKFIGLSAHALVNATHNESPWIEAFDSGTNISLKAMKDFYTQKRNARR